VNLTNVSETPFIARSGFSWFRGAIFITFWSIILFILVLKHFASEDDKNSDKSTIAVLLGKGRTIKLRPERLQQYLHNRSLMPKVDKRSLAECAGALLESWAARLKSVNSDDAPQFNLDEENTNDALLAKPPYAPRGQSNCAAALAAGCDNNRASGGYNVITPGQQNFVSHRGPLP